MDAHHLALKQDGQHAVQRFIDAAVAHVRCLPAGGTAYYRLHSAWTNTNILRVQLFITERYRSFLVFSILLELSVLYSVTTNGSITVDDTL
jgi:hypothetical protein